MSDKIPIYLNNNDKKYYTQCNNGIIEGDEVTDYMDDKYDITVVCKSIEGGRRRKSKKSKKAKKTKKSKKSKKTKKSRKH